jgi:sulfur carrier protein
MLGVFRENSVNTWLIIASSVAARENPRACYHFQPNLCVTPMSIQIQFNGEQRTIGAQMTLAALLAELPLAGKRFAVEHNGEIVPKSQLQHTTIADGDKLEIVIAVGGG